MNEKLNLKSRGQQAGEELKTKPDKVIAVGVGGGGCNTISTIANEGVLSELLA